MKTFTPQDNKLVGLLNFFYVNSWPVVKLFPSSVLDNFKPGQIFEINVNSSHWASELNTNNDQFLVISFPMNRLKLTHYSLRSHCDDPCIMNGWNLYGSNDNNSAYKLIHSREGTTKLGINEIAFYKINEEIPAYTYYKITQTSQNSKTGCPYRMRISGFEMFGKIGSPIEFNIKTCVKKHQPISFLISLYIFVS